ncbi:MAG: LysR family transcriptional regulator [Eubacteriales bacterium]|nr:LysR family transcriptional regulator [Eubacteriales bacterium]
MEIDYCNEFLVLSELKNLSDAAEELSVSESSLSRHIKALEDELGCSLFDRTSRSLKISRYGRLFLPYAREIVSLRQKCLKELSVSASREKATIPVVSNYYIGDILAGFLKENPGVIINELDSPNDNETIKNRLRRKDCLFAFMINLEDPGREFESFPFAADYHVAVVPESHPLCERGSVRLSDLAGEHFVSFKANSYSDMQFKELCRRSGFDPMISVTGDIGSSLVPFVRQGLGIAILRKNVLSMVGANLNGVRLIDLDPPARFIISLVYRRGAVLPPQAQQFLNYCHSHRKLQDNEAN